MRISKIKKEYDENGYIVIKKFLKKNLVKVIKDDLQKYITLNKKSFSRRNINVTKNNIINSIHDMEKWKWTKYLQKNENLVKIIEKLLETKIKNFGSEVFAKPAKYGLASPMHQDNFYWCIDDSKGLTVWISLDKSSSDNGAVSYFKESHNLGLLQHEPSFAPGSSQKIKHMKGLKKFKFIVPKLEPGDCLIHHCLIVHGSKKNLSNKPRIGWTLRFIGKKSKTDPFLKKNYENQLKKQIKLRK